MQSQAELCEFEANLKIQDSPAHTDKRKWEFKQLTGDTKLAASEPDDTLRHRPFTAVKVILYPSVVFDAAED
ncbi:hypothetical protein STEG23_022647 [Scotinomys teguina]